MNDRVLLCVDDEPGVLHALKRLLRKEGYRVVTARSGEEGLALLQKHPVQVVLADQRMPEMEGTEFLQHVKERYPDTVRVVLSGYADVHVILDSINKGEVYRFLPKPWNEGELKIIIRQCFEQYDLRHQNAVLVAQVQQQNALLTAWNGNLERLVRERTRSLQLAQEILEKLPMPVLGVDGEGMLVLVNAAANTVLAGQSALGMGAQVDDVLPEPAVQVVHRCLRERRYYVADRCPIGPRSFHLHATPLLDGGSTRGCILLLEADA